MAARNTGIHMIPTSINIISRDCNIFLAFLGPKPLNQVCLPKPLSASAATLANIFLLAARIISSLLFCNKACLSLLFWLHACCLLPGVLVVLALSEPDASESASALAILETRLYRVMRSGWLGFVTAGLELPDDAPVDAGTGRGGWNVCGGYLCSSSAQIPTNITSATSRNRHIHPSPMPCAQDHPQNRIKY